MTDSTQTRMAKGAIWMLLFRLVERGFGLISTLILARLLSPADFGVVAMALSFIAMAELLGAFSFDTAIIQNRSATPAHYNSAWTCSLILGAFISLLMVLLAHPIASFYRKPELSWVVMALAIGPLISGVQNIGVVAFLKELDFRKEFKFQVARKLVSFVVVVPLAFIFRSYWVLVIGMLISRSAGTVISYLMHAYRPRLDLSKASELFNFSRWLLINNFAGFFKERSADFFIGRIHGATSLGMYNIAYELANLPTTEIGAPINRAFLPSFAKMDDQSEIAKAYSNAVGFLSLVALPTVACMHALAPFLVAVLLGEKWLGAVGLMQLLAFNGALVLFHSSICAVLIGRGFPARVMYANLAYTFLLLSLLSIMFILLQGVGVIAAAYAALLTSLLATPLYLYQLWRCLGLGPALFVKSIARPLLASTCVILLLPWYIPSYHVDMSILQSLGWLIVGSALGVLTYAAAILLAWGLAGRPAGTEQIVLSKARELLKQRFGQPASQDRP